MFYFFSQLFFKKTHLIIPFSFRPHAFGVCFFPTLQETLPIRLSFHPSVHPSGSRRKVRNCTFTIPCVYVCDNIETQRGWKSIRENGASSDLGTHLYLFHVSILFHPQDRASCQNKTTRELEKNLNSQTNYTLNSLFKLIESLLNREEASVFTQNLTIF